jgi:hypothetical protein
MVNLTHSNALFGIFGTLQGFLDISEGKIKEGLKKTIFNQNLINISARCMNVSYTFHRTVMQYSLAAGAALGAIKGIVTSINGVRSRKAKEIIKGCALTALGLISSAYITSLNSRIVAFVNEAPFFGMIGYYFTSSGIKDIKAKKYLKGLGKILCGIATISCYAYYAYNTYFKSLSVIPYNEEISIFVNEHSDELHEKIDTNPGSAWEEVGSGVSKKTFSHRDLKNYVIKIPRVHSFRRHHMSDIETHIENVQIARKIIMKYNFTYLVTPDTYLIQGLKTPIEVETKFDLLKSSCDEIPDSAEKTQALLEFNSFMIRSKFCDMFAEVSHNAAFLRNSTKTKIALFDLDCIDI